MDDVGDSCEIIVVDNKSSDGSAQLVRERYPQVRLIENRENRGFAAGCSQGAGAATTDVLVFLNQDTRVCAGWLSNLLAALNSDASIGLVTSMLVLMSDPDKINACGQDVHFSGLAFLRGLMQPRESKLYRAQEEVNAVAGASFAIRRSLWQDLGGFDDTLFMYYEETDLSWRAQLAGFSCVYAPGSVVYHDYRPARPSPSSLIYSKRNRYILLLKQWRWATLLLLLPGLLLAELVDWAHSILIGKPGVRAKISAYNAVIGLWPAIMVNRRNAQQLRRVDDAVLLQTSVPRLSPVEFTGGRIGNIATRVVNILLQVNRAIALLLCRIFGL